MTKGGTDPATNSTATSGGAAGTTGAGNVIDWVVGYRNTSGATADIEITDPITGNHSYVSGSLLVPPGLSPQWSTDGGASYVGSEPGSGVNAVGATGTSQPGSTAAEAQTSDPPPAAIPADGGGDGWEALFIGDNVYNVLHHTGGTRGGSPAPTIDCHVRTTGTRCAEYPTYVSPNAGDPFGTGPTSMVTANENNAAVVGSKIYFPVGMLAGTSIGVACADIAAQTSCGYTELGTAPTTASTFVGPDINGGALVGSRYFLLGPEAQIFCFDVVAEAVCPGFPLVGVADPGVTAPASIVADLEAFDDRYLFANVARAGSPTARDLACVDLTTNASCPGFPRVAFAAPTTGVDSTLVPILSSTGQVQGICSPNAATNNVHPFACFDLDGNAVSTPFSTTQTSGTGVNVANRGSIEAVGSRIYFAETLPSGTFASTYTCWDYATNSTCTGFAPSTTGQSMRTYTLRQDPQNPDCLWALGDFGRFEVFSATFGGTSCNEGNAVVDLEPADYYCDGQAGHVSGWDAITLEGISAGDYDAAAVTITDANGDPVPGWQSQIFSDSQQSIDISSIPYSGSTENLRVAVAVSWGDHDVQPVTVRVSFDGDPPQVCFQTTVGAAECVDQEITNSANAVTQAGDVTDAPGGHDSGPVAFTLPGDDSICPNPPGKPKLFVSKRASTEEVHRGEVLTYRITVRNKGKADARRVRVCDRLPSGQKVLRAPGADHRTRRVCWKIPRLAAGAKRSFRITTQVKTGAEPGNQRNKVVAAARGINAARDGETVSVSPSGGNCPRFARC